jgi:K+-transporting ATPase A subunit
MADWAMHPIDLCILLLYIMYPICTLLLILILCKLVPRVLGQGIYVNRLDGSPCKDLALRVNT